MDAYLVTVTDETPEVVLNPAENIFLLKGKALPEDANEFFSPIIDWFSAYIKETSGKMVFDFELDYFNTASSKYILDIFLLFDEYADKDITVNWIYNEDDEDMEEAGEEYLDMLSSVKLELKPQT